jgi:hypothetical protein
LRLLNATVHALRVKPLLLTLALLAALPLRALDLAGSVYAAEGTPLRGAVVSVHRVGSADALAEAKTDDGGEFALSGLPDVVVEVDVRADGYALERQRAVFGDLPLVFTLARGAQAPVAAPVTGKQTRGGGTVGGRVRVDGRPLAGAPVTIVTTEATAPAQTVADAEGRYRFSGLAPDTYTISIGTGLEPRLRNANEGRMVQDGRDPSFADLKEQREATVDLDLVAVPIVSGRVLDADGKPVAGTLVQVILPTRSSLDFAQSPLARTSRDGRYALAMPPFQPAESAVVAAGGRTHSVVRSKPFVVGTASRRIDLTLPRMAAVTLRVVDADGKAIPGASVAFAASDEVAASLTYGNLLQPIYAARVSRTGATGELALQLLAGTYDFIAAAAGFQTATLTRVAVTRPGPVTMKLQPAFTIRGRVHRNRIGVANVIVWPIVDRDIVDVAPVTTAADGRFELAGLPRGKYQLSVTKHEELVNETAEAEAPSTPEIALAPAGMLQARVFDAASGRPLQSFNASVEPADAILASAWAAPRLDLSPGSGDGVFTATLPRGAYRIRITAAGYTEGGPFEARVAANETAKLDLPMDHGATIAGRITDDQGAPVAKASVFATPDETSLGEDAARGSAGNATTAVDGTYTMSGISRGAVTLSVRAERFVPLRRSLVAEGLMTVDLTLERGLTVNGMVRLDGKPLRGASVDAVTAALGGDYQSDVTDANGRFVLRGLVPARYTVNAYAESLPTVTASLDPTHQQELNLSLDAKPVGVLFGIVTGLPPAGRGKAGHGVVQVDTAQESAEGLVDEGGNYRIENAPSGTITVIAHYKSTTAERRSPPRTMELEAGQAVRVDLDLGGTISVHGAVTADGKPMPGIAVGFVKDGSDAGAATTREDGTYEMPLAAPGTYLIFARVADRGPSGLQLREIRGGETVNLDLAEQVVSGTIVDAASQEPIAGASVTLTADVPNVAETLGDAVVGREGRFQLLTGASGSYRLVASAPGYAQATQRIQLGNGDRQVAFALDKTAALRVRVVDARTGVPLTAGVTITTPDRRALPVGQQQSDAGSITIFWLAAGKYRLTINVGGYASKEVEVTAPGSVDVAME